MAFEPLSQEEIQQLAAPAVVGQLSAETQLAGFEPLSQEEASQFARGGIGAPVSRDEAKRIAAERLVARERAAGFRPGDLLLKSEAQQLADQAGIPLGDVGEVVSTSQFAPTLQGRMLEALTGARQAASGMTFGTAGALGRTVEDLILNEAEKKVLGSQALKERAPAAAVGGESIGGLVPTGLVGKAVLQPGASVLQRVIAGARVGAPIGAVSGASKTVEEQGLETDLTDIIQNTLIGGGVGTVVGGGLPLAAQGISKAITGSIKTVKGVAQPIKTLQDAGILRTPEAIATDILNPSGAGEVREVAEDIIQGRVLEGFQTIKKNSSFNNFPTLIDSGKKTLKVLGSEIESFITSNPRVRINADDAADAMLDRVLKDPLLMQRNPEVADMVLNNAATISKDLTLREGFDLLKSINGRHENYFTASVKGQTTKLQDAEFATDEIMRRYLSRKLNDATEAITGLERNPFREYGSVSEVVSQSTKRFHDALVERLQQTSGKGVVSDFIQKFDFSKPLSSLKQPLTFLRGGELGRLNRRIESLSEKLPSQESAKVLTAAERAERLRRSKVTP